MNETPQRPARPELERAVCITAGEDRFGEYRGVGRGVMDFKVATQDSSALFILEITLHTPGGPARHLHRDQDEWFYVVEGEFILEVGQERMTLQAGDSVFAPRKVPHVWAYVGGTRGRMLFALTPAGKIEAFFREITQANAMAPQEPALWRRYDMELLGPPLPIP